MIERGLLYHSCEFETFLHRFHVTKIRDEARQVFTQTVTDIGYVSDKIQLYKAC